MLLIEIELFAIGLHQSKLQPRMGTATMDKRRRRTCLGLAVAAVAVVSGCGQKGPLYFPEDRLEELKKKRRQGDSPKKDG